MRGETLATDRGEEWRGVQKGFIVGTDRVSVVDEFLLNQSFAELFEDGLGVFGGCHGRSEVMCARSAVVV